MDIAGRLLSALYTLNHQLTTLLHVKTRLVHFLLPALSQRAHFVVDTHLPPRSERYKRHALLIWRLISRKRRLEQLRRQLAELAVRARGEVYLLSAASLAV